MRNRYLDLLRAAAIVRVVVYHLFGWPWLSLLLPAMGIMFALAGSLTAASLDRRGAAGVIGSRLRRLLPPLWLLGLIAVPLMLLAGWAAEEDGAHPFSPARLAFWLLPLGDPPGSDRGVDVWEPLWYLRAYVWFVLLSPLVYRAYRRAGWVVVAAPIVLLAALDRTGFSLPDPADAAMWDFATYGACWIAGFAHHDGRLARARPPLVVAAAVVLGGAALYWLRGHPGENGWDLNDVSESQALWSLAVVLLVLRWQPPMDWLSRVRPLDAAVTLLNNRAVTVYLWHNVAIAAVWPVLGYVALDDLGVLDGPVDLVTALVLTAVAVLLFGWAEDLAGQRRPAWWPVRQRVAAVAAAEEPAGRDRSGVPESVLRFAAGPQPGDEEVARAIAAGAGARSRTGTVFRGGSGTSSAREQEPGMPRVAGLPQQAVPDRDGRPAAGTGGAGWSPDDEGVTPGLRLSPRQVPAGQLEFRPASPARPVPWSAPAAGPARPQRAEIDAEERPQPPHPGEPR